MATPNYWQRLNQTQLRRRRLLGGAATLAAGAAGLALVGCGDDDDTKKEGGTAAPAGTTTGTQGATATTAAAQPVKGGTLRTGTFLNVLGIDPHIEVGLPGLNTGARTYTFLGGFDRINQKWMPLVAEKYEQVSPTEFVFTLRKDVKFQNIAPMNGRQLNADDVLYSLSRFRDHPQAQNNSFFKSIVDKMSVVDPFTFKITTKAPYAESLSEIGGIQVQIVGKEDVEQRKDLSNGGVGAGPYIIDEYVKGERTVQKRNPDYFDKSLPYPDKWSLVTILDMNTLIQAYKSDQIDINGALLNKLDFDEIQKNKNLVSEKFPALHYGSLGMNASRKPFDDPKVRQAIYVGIDRKQFIDKVFQGEATPMGPLNNGLEFWVLPQDQLKPYIGPDVKKAKDLLSAAGYPDGFEMEIDTSGGVQLYIDHAEVLLSELAKIGIKAKLKLSDLPTYLSTKLFTGDFASTVFTHNPYETPKIPLGFYHKDGIGNGSWWHYNNPKVTELVDKQAQELDPQKRKQLVLDAQKAILDDSAPLLNFASPTLFSSYNKRVGGYDPKKRGAQSFLFSEYIKPG